MARPAGDEDDAFVRAAHGQRGKNRSGDEDGSGSGLDADSVRGFVASAMVIPNTLVARDGSGNIGANAGTFLAAVTIGDTLGVVGNVTSGGQTNNFGLGTTPAGTVFTTTTNCGSSSAAFMQTNANGFAVASLGVNNSGTPQQGIPSGSYGLGTINNIPFVFTQAGTERGRIDVNGDFNFGTTSPTGVKVNIVNLGYTSTTVRQNTLCRISSNASNADTTLVLTDGVTHNYFMSGTGGVLRWANGNSNPGTTLTLDQAGNLSATGTVAGQSDARLKENVKTIDGALEKTKALRGVTFDWKASGAHSLGVIAQEIQAVLPQLVLIDELTGMRSVAYGNLTGLLIEAIKELSARVEALEAAK